MKSIENAPEEVQQAIQNIIDVMSCADGGVDFSNFLGLINSLSYNLKNNLQVESTEMIFEVIIRFSRLLDAAKNNEKYKTKV